MKNNRTIILVCSFVVIGGLLCMIFWFLLSNVETFSLSEYEWEMENFQTVKNVGRLDDKNIAINQAKKLWQEKYQIDINKAKIKIAYDAGEECWHAYSAPTLNTLGGVYHAIIRKNGEVLALWCED